MITPRGFAHFQDEDAIFVRKRIERGPICFSQLKAGWQWHSEFRRVTLDYRSVAKSGDAQLRIADGHDALDVRKKTHFALRHRRGNLSGGPPHARRLAGLERRLDDCVAVISCAAGNQARLDAHVRVVAGQIESKERCAGRRNRDDERSAPGFNRERRRNVQRN